MFKRLTQWTMCCGTARLDRISASPQRAARQGHQHQSPYLAIGFPSFFVILNILHLISLQCAKSTRSSRQHIILAPKLFRSCFTQTHVVARPHRGLFEHRKNNSSLCLTESLPAMTKTLCLQRRGAERLCWEEARISDSRGGKWWRDPSEAKTGGCYLNRQQEDYSLV